MSTSCLQVVSLPSTYREIVAKLSLIDAVCAFTLVLAFNLPSDIAAGVKLVGCCPGGTSTNVMSYLGKGDVP